MVDAPVPGSTERRECTTAPEIVDACIRENMTRFWQASHTPFMQPHMREKVGDLAEKQGAEEILRTGKLTMAPDDPPLTATQKAFMAQLKLPDDQPTLSRSEVEITKEKHVRSWKGAREQTSSADDVLHFGHYIATCQDDELAQFEADMRNFPFLTGFSPIRWQECFRRTRHCSHLYFNGIRARSERPNRQALTVDCTEYDR